MLQLVKLASTVAARASNYQERHMQHVELSNSNDKAKGGCKHLFPTLVTALLDLSNTMQL